MLTEPKEKEANGNGDQIRRKMNPYGNGLCERSEGRMMRTGIRYSSRR